MEAHQRRVRGRLCAGGACTARRGGGGGFGNRRPAVLRSRLEGCGFGGRQRRCFVADSPEQRFAAETVTDRYLTLLKGVRHCRAPFLFLWVLTPRWSTLG